MADRRALLRQLAGLAEIMLQGTVSETYRTCGTPGCHCHQGALHGPHTYLSYKKPDKKTSGVYVPVAARQRVREGTEAWKKFWELAAELATENRIRTVERWRAEGTRGRRGHAAT